MNIDLTFSDNVIDNFNPNEILNEYKLLFRDRTSKPISIETNYDKIKFVASKLYSKLNIPMNNVDKKIKGKKQKVYQLNHIIIDNHQHLMIHSNKHYAGKYSQFYKYINQIPKDFQLKLTDINIDIEKKGH